MAPVCLLLSLFRLVAALKLLDLKADYYTQYQLMCCLSEVESR